MNKLLRLTNAAAALSLAAMVGVCVLDVFLRYVFNRPIAASIELVEVAIVGAVFMALPDASARGMHVGIDYLDHALPPRLLRLLDRISHAVIALMLAGLTVLLMRRGVAMIQRGDQSAALHYPTGILAFIMGAASAATAVVHAARAVAPAPAKSTEV